MDHEDAKTRNDSGVSSEVMWPSSVLVSSWSILSRFRLRQVRDLKMAQPSSLYPHPTVSRFATHWYLSGVRTVMPSSAATLAATETSSG